ncbi:hypothetical protein BH11MYX4_BH11MYX4_27860 [soil metagenome]
MMPSSYREPDQRDDDRIVYFDYAKSLESRRAPFPWKVFGRAAAATLLTGVVTSVYAFVVTRELAHPLLCMMAALVCIPGMIPLLLSNRALSGENISSVKRGRR